jgi:hypothetical protein
MKTPDKILFEYASDSVTCFHGHPLTWTEFGNCCDDFFKRNYGIRPCYWKLLEANGFNADEVRAFRALDFLTNELDGVLLDPAFKLTMFFQEHLKGFVDPKNLLRFETEAEALSRCPKLDYAELLQLTAERKDSIYQLYKMRRACQITTLSIDTHSVWMKTIVRDNDRLTDEFKPTHSKFKEYLSTLSGLPPLVSVDRVGPACPPVVSVRSEATPGKRRSFRITLLSLLKCSVEEYDQRGEEV